MNRCFIIGLAAALALAWSCPVKAKPLSYPGGLMVMQENDQTGNTISVDYTFDPHFALGVYTKHDAGRNEFYMVGPQLNTLIKRWNLPDGQGNIFSMNGAGLARQCSNTQPAAWISLLADYETRRVFLSYEPRLVYAGNIEKSFWQRASVGVAPYLANYDQLNTWLMLKVDHHPAKEDHFVVTPFIRFFYKTIWFEAGYSSDKHVLLNWTKQF